MRTYDKFVTGVLNPDEFSMSSCVPLERPSTLFWLELTRGGLWRLITAVAVASLLIAIAGVVALLVSGPDNHFPPYNGLLAIGLLLVIGAVIAIPRLARRFMTVSSPVLSVGILAVVATAVYSNLSQFV